MGVGNIDTNLYLRRNQHHALLFAVAVVFSSAATGFCTRKLYLANTSIMNHSQNSAIFQVYWLPGLPFLYLLIPWRFNQIMSIQSANTLRFTELFGLSIFFLLLAESADHFLCAHTIDLSSALGTAESHVDDIIGALYLLGAITMAIVYRTRRAAGDR
jgi:hypothetical protein